MEYIVSQIFVCLTYICFGLTYFTSNRNKILIVCLLALLFNGVHYSLLSAWAGLGVVIVAVIRNVLFMIQERIPVLDKYIIDDWIILITLLIISVVVAAITYDSIFCLFSIVSSIVYTISVWQKNVKVYRILGLVASVLSLVYLVYISSIFGIILESLLFVTMLISTIIFSKKEKSKNLKMEKVVV